MQRAVQDVGVRVHLCVLRGRLMRNGTLVLLKKIKKERQSVYRCGYTEEVACRSFEGDSTHRAVSHCSAVLYASLGGDVGPGQQGAQQGLGLPVQPLWDGAGAQAGQG